MKRTWKSTSRLVTSILAAILVFAAVPECRAQDQAGASTPTPSQAQILARMQQLEQQLNDLQKEMAALKASENSAPGLKTAALVEPASQPAPTEAVATPAPVSVPAAAPADEPQKVSIASLLGPTTISGFVDAYYGFNFNHPANLQNGLVAFDANTNQFGLNMTELVVNKTPDATAGIAGRTGYDIAIGYGQAMNAVNQNATDSGFDQYLKEAYFSYLAPIGKGLKIDVGKFVTTAGEEVIETNANWNYSRSILFYYAIPYYHFGARATYAPNSKWSFQGTIANGWNDVVDFSSAKTYGASVSWTPNAKWGVTETYYGGPQIEPGKFSNTSDWRQLSDTIFSYTPNSKWAFALNGDYGYGDRVYNTLTTPPTPGPAVDWWGSAAYAKYTWTANDNLAVRYEYYGDPQGYTLFGYGTKGHAQEFTTTYTHMLTSELMTRLEYRYDFASVPIFEKGAIPNDVKTQNTLTLGMVYSFSSQNAK